MKTVSLFCVSITVLILMIGCAVPPQRVVVSDKPIFKPEFEKSNVIQIEKSIDGLEVISSIKSVLSRNHKIVVVSMEKPHSEDSMVSYLIEDNLITDLTKAKYNVLERDEDLLYRLISESGGGRKKKGYRVVIEPRSIEEVLDIQSADKILSYRVLECGILLESSKNKTYGNGGYDYIRYARTKLHIRVVDVKTGQIELATILENEVQDIIPSGLAQTLSTIHFTYYDYTLPNSPWEKEQVQSTEIISSGRVDSTPRSSGGRKKRGMFGTGAKTGKSGLIHSTK